MTVAALLEVDSVDLGGLRVVGVRGELDLATAGELAGNLDEAAHTGVAGVVVDLSRVSFIDPAGLAVLWRAHRGFGEAGVPVSVVCPPGGAPARLVAAAGLDRTFDVHEARETAVAAVLRRYVS